LSAAAGRSGTHRRCRIRRGRYSGSRSILDRAPGSALPAGWTPLAASNIKTLTRYTLVDDGGVTVLRAESQAGASGLSRPLRVHPAEFPWLRWRWKIDNLIAGADLRTREWRRLPGAALCDVRLPAGQLPFLERNKLRLARALFDPIFLLRRCVMSGTARPKLETLVPRSRVIPIA